ncbi:MAG: cupredoxin domain-containing protein [Alphaproteobacteria bacterium]|nr:cupredoxin domain-containing protein [Alphaproteobacteria bacterium]
MIINIKVNHEAFLSVSLAAITLATFSLPALAAEEFTIVIKDHKFTPETLEVPTGKKIKLIVKNEDPTPEEFESHDLMREKIINGNSKGIVFIGPLEPGEYSYFGEFNMDTALGTIVAK